MQARLPYAKLRLSTAIERFMSATDRQEKAMAARWVSAWAHLAESCTCDKEPRPNEGAEPHSP